MMTCKEVSTLVASGQIDDAKPGRRLAVWLHLTMCRGCRAFSRQMADIGHAAQVNAKLMEQEPGPGFETRLVHALRPETHDPDAL